MKKIIIGISIFLPILFSCTDNYKYRTGNVSPVEALMAPEDGYYIELESGASATTRFAWSPASAEDGSLPQYEVVFFRNPDGEIVYRVDAASGTSVEITHKELNKAASAAGIPTGESGTVYWAVVASRGITESDVTVTPYTLEITRLLGFETIPAEIYITGEGSEGGSDLSGACKAIKGDEEGVFTLYHQLQAGKGYIFVDGTGDSRTSYTVTDGLLDDKSTTPATVDADGIYRISLDFNIKSFTIESVTGVIYNFADDHTKEMEYTGNGTWILENYECQYKDSGFEEDRYNFRATVGGVEMLWGYESGDSNRPGTDTGSYFYIHEYVYDGNRWQNPYKFAQKWDGTTVDITIYQNGDGDHPYHVVSAH